jgi:hypothetical protein
MRSTDYITRAQLYAYEGQTSQRDGKLHTAHLKWT